MTGLIALALFSFFIFILKVITDFIYKKLEKTHSVKRENSSLVKFFIYVVLFLFIFADEIAGNVQLSYLCNKDSILIYDKNKIKNKTVSRSIQRRVNLSYTALPITETLTVESDVETGEVIISYKEYKARKGGWFSRLLNVQGTSVPYTFKGYCALNKEVRDLHFNHNIKSQATKVYKK